MALTVADVRRKIKNVPGAEKEMPALVVDGQIFTWNKINSIIEKKHSIVEKIFTEIENMNRKLVEKRFDFEINFSGDELLLVSKRLSSMPPEMGILTLGTVFTRDDLIKQLGDRTSLGARIARRELNYVATLWSK